MMLRWSMSLWTFLTNTTDAILKFVTQKRYSRRFWINCSIFPLLTRHTFRKHNFWSKNSNTIPPDDPATLLGALLNREALLLGHGRVTTRNVYEVGCPMKKENGETLLSRFGSWAAVLASATCRKDGRRCFWGQKRESYLSERKTGVSSFKRR